jgi:type I restriction enzyme S subunit
MSFPRYEEYKDSGVESLGRIPSHWISIQLKRRARILTEKGSRRECPIGLENVEGWTGRFVATDSDFEGEGVQFETGDVLFGKLRPYLAKVYLADRAGEAVGDFHVIRIGEGLKPRFAQYQMLTPEFIAIVDGSTFGSKMPRASWEFVGNMFFAIPPLPEQHAIAYFLDRETSKIDALVSEQRRLVELLKEKRQAVISHAVTKGLDPTVPMKPSGIPWLGDVPEHWTVSSLKHHVSTVNGFGFSSTDFQDDGVPFIRAGNIKDKSITPPTVFLPEEVVAKYQRVALMAGDIVISMVGSDPKIVESAVGQVGIIPESLAGAVPNQNIVILRENFDFIEKRYLFYTLCGTAYRNHLNVFSHNLANQSIISSSLLVAAKFAFPAIEEQREIIKHLDRDLAASSQLLVEAERSITLLQERRTALISAAVTGKIDVRGFASEGARP